VRRTTIMPLVTGSVLALLLAGCGALGLPGGDDTSAAERPAQKQGTSATAASQDEAPADRRSAPPDRVLATRTISTGKTELRVEITGLKREGKLTTLSWTVTNTGDRSWDMSSKLGDINANLGLTVAGVSLIDRVNGKRYRVARTGEYPNYQCVCSDYDIETHPGEVLHLYAVFGSPPPEVTKVDVEMKALGVFTDVPIS
jgi:hypothetical protein